MQDFLTLGSALIPLDMRESFPLSTNSTSTPTGLDQDVLFKSLKSVRLPALCFHSFPIPFALGSEHLPI